jgi:exodeoxyribonuclease VII large subunit
MIFPAALQGDKAIATIPIQLNKIRKLKHHFDAVAIIRGGGGELSFVCYNNYELSKAIATFPLPIVTGIGHVTNLTVVDMVANQTSITPTKLAEFFIQKFHNFSVPVQDAEKKIIDKSRRLISDEKTKFQSEIKLFRSVTSNVLITNKNTLKENIQILLHQSTFTFKSENEYLNGIKQGIIKGTSAFCNSSKLILVQFGQSIKKDTIASVKQLSILVTQKTQQILNGSKIIFKIKSTDILNLEKNIDNMSPQTVIKRGYSITLLNGKSVKAYIEVKQGDILSTIIHEGQILSTVNSTSKPIDQ